MTLEKTVFLSIILHAVILTVLSFTINRPYETMHPFEVNLVASPDENPSASKEEARGVPPEIPKISPEAPAENPKPSMVVHPDRPGRRQMEKQQSLIGDALAKVRSTQARDEEIKSALEKVEGITNAQNKIAKLMQINKTLETSKKKQTLQTVSAVAAGANGNAISAYAGIVQSKIQGHWGFADLRSSGMTATISVTILKDGTIVPMGFDRHSGNKLLDSSAMRAIQLTGKVPPPPDGAPLEIAIRFTPLN